MGRLLFGVAAIRKEVQMPAKTPNATRKPSATAWKPGQSGNPKGRPQGSKNKTTLVVEALMQGKAEAVTQKAVELALEGDAAMIRVILDRVSPVPKDKPLTIALPPLKSAADLPAAMSSILESVASGEVTPSEATALAGLVETHRRALETSSLEERIAALETKGV